MPPLEPIEYRAIRALQAQLGAMSVAEGYHYDLAVSEVRLDPNVDVESLIAPGGPRPFAAIEVRPDVRDYFPADQVTIVLPVTIHWVNTAVPADDESRLQVLLRGVADIERAICVDQSLGGLVMDTRMVNRAFDAQDGGALVWLSVDLELRIYRTYGQPDS